MTLCVTRQMGKYKGKSITPPSPEEILDDNFNYPDYIERVLNLKYNDDFVADFFDSREYNPVDPFVKQINDIFEEAIVEVQKQYEEDLKNKTVSLDYNQEMKKIAQAFFDSLKYRITLNLEKEAKYNAMIVKMAELVTVLNKVVDIKREVETGAEARLIAACNKEIPLGNLYMSDLEKFQNSEAYKRFKEMYHITPDLISGELQDADGIQYKPIRELNRQRKN